MLDIPETGTFGSGFASTVHNLASRLSIRTLVHRGIDHRSDMLRFVTHDLGDSVLKYLHFEARSRQYELSCLPIHP